MILHKLLAQNKHLRTLILYKQCFESQSQTHQHPQLRFFLVLKLNSILAIQKGCLKQCKTRLNHNFTQQDSTYLCKDKLAHKDSSCDLPLSNTLMFTILCSNASSSSTKVLKCTQNKNDFIFTRNFFNKLQLRNHMHLSHSQRRIQV